MCLKPLIKVILNNFALIQLSAKVKSCSSQSIRGALCGNATSITVRKRRDPAILDREELFLQLKIEEIFLVELSNLILNIIFEVANMNLCAE